MNNTEYIEESTDEHVDNHIEENNSVTSDEETDYEDDTNSIYDEIDDLIIKCHEQHHYHHTTINTLNNIHKLIVQSANIRIVTDEVQRDFDELLEELHEQSLENIQATGKMTFGEDLKSVIERGVFDKN